MPNARSSRRKKKPAEGGTQSGSKGRFKVAVYSALLGLVFLGGLSFWQSQTCEAAFLDLAGAHKGPLEQVQTLPNLGNSHLARGQSYRYPTRFPTSGPHAPVWAMPGVYSELPPDVELVHALEHGNIVIYYDQLGDEDFAKLESWAGLYGGQWSGLVVARRSGLGTEVVLTAWTKMLRMKTFNASKAAVFIDEYRGRGPEHRVR